MDCSTKSRAREICRVFDMVDQHQGLFVLLNLFPEGLPNLSSSEQTRVDTDNRATSFILDQIQSHAERGGGSIRENPWRSLHWYLPQKQQMMNSGLWRDKRYSSCCLMGARAKSQCLRHNLDEISQWPVLDCQHYHDPREWDPYLVGDTRVYPSHEEHRSIGFCYCSLGQLVVGKAKLRVPRMPAFFCHGRRDRWLGGSGTDSEEGSRVI